MTRVGSSPLARGLLNCRRYMCSSCGIIPARAGFTKQQFSTMAIQWDHPRSRGVYRKIRATASNMQGSSPLARGLPLHIPAELPDARIIPARAGFTRFVVNTVHYLPDHPRSRGVYDSKQKLDDFESGSSPLARGLPGVLIISARAVGIIPARAGFTTRSSG